MDHEHVISGLVRKRAEIAGQLEAAHALTVRLVATLESMDTTIRLFEPKIDLSNVRVRPAPSRMMPLYGEITQLAFGVLRDAPQPMTVRAITLAMMRQRGLPTEDTDMVDGLRDRVGQALRTARNRGTAVSEANERMEAVWRVGDV